MGRMVGNGIVLAAQEAVKRKAALITVPSTGGARMQEGVLSLMQLPRTISAVDQVRDANHPVPFIHHLISRRFLGPVRSSNQFSKIMVIYFDFSQILLDWEEKDLDYSSPS